LAQPLSLLCKSSPLIDELALYDVVNTPGVAADLSHISSVAVGKTKSPGAVGMSNENQKISGYLPKDDGMKKALTGADICIIPAGIPSTVLPPLREPSALTTSKENLA
jgi:malate dehydrogenase